ncbi:helix-hairpin-helix domain-containing protein [uncultured Aquitalea sp.]|uniref:helix-hairpin-helix domain-containing protein n=1 Tax=uncultured Aquitalea sp. TaxID=540272 RepID=UPI0025FBF1F0|nr:helix-hairpin-helix domain-containing protein [uncultured Aquitalea sp.]
MHPDRCKPPEHTRHLQELPNIGPAMAVDLQLLGIHEPSQLKGRDALALYRELGVLTQCRQDPCVLDTLMSVTHFMDTGEALPWWRFTAARKAMPGDPAGGFPC